MPSVVAAGNDFDSRGYGSISSPGTSATAITVAATSTHARLRRQRRASAATGSPALDAVHGGAVDRAARDARAHASRRASSARAAYGLDRRACREPSRRRALRAVVIVLRGGCGFGTKAINAHEAGARAVIVESDRPGPPFVVEEEADLPLLAVTDVVGRELRAYIAARRRRRARALHARRSPSCRRRRAC